MLLSSTASVAQPGSLDSTFSGDGKVKTNFAAGDDAGYSVAIQADGKIIQAGDLGNYSPNPDNSKLKNPVKSFAG